MTDQNQAAARDAIKALHDKARLDLRTARFLALLLDRGRIDVTFADQSHSVVLDPDMSSLVAEAECRRLALAVDAFALAAVS